MNKREIKTAEKLLDNHVDRFSLASNDCGGTILTAYWTDGGQKLFGALQEVEDWIYEYEWEKGHISVFENIYAKIKNDNRS